jgi:hypothetical protein
MNLLLDMNIPEVWVLTIDPRRHRVRALPLRGGTDV